MMSMHTCLKFRNGTNWTMSRRTGSPLGDLRIPSSPSSICMSLKSAFPTPTMMTDMGRCEAWTIASRVSAMSVMTPSVRISRMKYCCGRRESVTGDNEGRGGGENDNSISQISIFRWPPCRVNNSSRGNRHFACFFNFFVKKNVMLKTKQPGHIYGFITGHQQLSAYGQSCFICCPHLYFILFLKCVSYITAFS